MDSVFIVCMAIWELGSDEIYFMYNTGERNEPEKNYNNKNLNINIIWTPSPTHQTSIQNPTSDKSQGGGGGAVRTTGPSTGGGG